MPINERPSDEFITLLRKSGDGDINVAQAAQREFAKALELPLRKGVLVGNILGNIFETINVEAGSTTEFPLDLISPGLEGEHVAYTNPGHGRIPERSVEGDYVMIPTYSIASSVDYLLRYAREELTQRSTQLPLDLLNRNACVKRLHRILQFFELLEGGLRKHIRSDTHHLSSLDESRAKILKVNASLFR